MVARVDNGAVEDRLKSAAERLAGKGLFGPSDRLSMRVPEQQVFVALGSGGVEWGRLADENGGMHRQIYRRRADVGAIFSGALRWSWTLSAMQLAMPAVFDEQVRHLGVETRRLAVRVGADVLPDGLTNGANAYVLDDGALCFGMGLERLLQNIEILEKCAESFVLASASGGTVRRIPWLIRFIANGRLRKDQKDAAARHLRGEWSVAKAGY